MDLTHDTADTPDKPDNYLQKPSKSLSLLAQSRMLLSLIPVSFFSQGTLSFRWNWSRHCSRFVSLQGSSGTPLAVSSTARCTRDCNCAEHVLASMQRQPVRNPENGCVDVCNLLTSLSFFSPSFWISSLHSLLLQFLNSWSILLFTLNLSSTELCRSISIMLLGLVIDEHY